MFNLKTTTEFNFKDSVNLLVGINKSKRTRFKASLKKGIKNKKGGVVALVSSKIDKINNDELSSYIFKDNAKDLSNIFVKNKKATRNVVEILFESAVGNNSRLNIANSIVTRTLKLGAYRYQLGTNTLVYKGKHLRKRKGILTSQLIESLTTNSEVISNV